MRIVILLRILLYTYLFTSGNLAEFGDEYFGARENGDIKVVEKRRRNLEMYKSVLNSKSDEDALVCTRSLLLFLIHMYTTIFELVDSVLMMIY